MSWINFPGFRGGPAAVTHGHGSHDHNVTSSNAAAVNDSGSHSDRGRDIRKNLIHCAELKKLGNNRFYSEVLRKKFFVLYEDSRRSVTIPRDRSNSGEPSDEEDEGYVPARLEYYNNQRNWESGERPRRVIVLRNVFTITRKRDTRESIHKYVIAIYTVEDCLGIVFDTEEVMKTWLEMLISCQMGGRSIEGRIPKPKYEHVYEVDVQQFEPELSSNTFQMSGPHRMVVTANDVKYFAVGSNKEVSFLISSIRGCSISKANRRLFKLEIGRSSESGSGVLVMKCNDEEISDSIRETMYAGMRAMSENSGNSSMRHRPRSSIPLNSNNIRVRTHSWSNMDKKTGTSFGTTSKTMQHHHHHRQHSSVLGDRHRTTSEGNSHFDLKRTLRGGGGKSITSGSPMSPGSFISSESAGSSNSLDDTDDNRMMTPSEDHVGPATIFEESSAESCVEQHHYHSSSNTTGYLKNPAPMESRLADSVKTSVPLSVSSSHVVDNNINYTPIDIVPSTSGFTNTGMTSHIMASSPPGTSVHYSTILMDANSEVTMLANNHVPPEEEEDQGSTKEDNSYMLMSPPTSTSSSKVSNTTRGAVVSLSEQIRHKPLSGLIADHDFEADTSASSVTSPNSQSSYNPLLDEVQTDESNSAYVMMSPATSTTSTTTAPRKISHQRSGSNSLVRNEDYVDMSPASRVGMPIPNRNERTSSLSFGTSPSAALTSHLVSYGDQPLANSRKTPTSSEDSPYLIMSPVDPEAKSDFSSRRSTPPVKLRTASIDSTSTGGSINTRPKTTRGRFYRGQSDSQRSSLCFEDNWDLGISPQEESSGGTLMGPPSEVGHEPLDYAPIELGRSSTISKVDLDSLQPVAAISRLRLDNEEPLDIDAEDEEDEDEPPSSTDPHHPSAIINPRAYSVGCRPPSLLTGSSSSVSTAGSGSSHHHQHSRHKSRFIDIPGATTASGTSGTGTGSHASSISPGTALITGHSPSSMAARFGSWIRHRTGSVPSKSAVSGRRRHRTQSEGEKDDL